MQFLVSVHTAQRKDTYKGSINNSLTNY